MTKKFDFTRAVNMVSRALCAGCREKCAFVYTMQQDWAVRTITLSISAGGRRIWLRLAKPNSATIVTIPTTCPEYGAWVPSLSQTLRSKVPPMSVDTVVKKLPATAP